MEISYLTEGLHTVPCALVSTLQQFEHISNEIINTRYYNL